MEIIVSDHNQIHSIYDSTTCILRSRYSGLFKAEIALNHFNAVELFSQTHKIKGVLADLRKLSGSFNKILEYLSSEGYPEMKKTGLEAEALVISNDLMIENLSVKLAALIKKKHIKSNIFRSHEEANTWLLKAVKN